MSPPPPVISILEAMNLAGLDFGSVGNHEFDDGLVELLRPSTRRLPARVAKAALEVPSAFKGAGFQYLAASTIDDATGKPILPPTNRQQFDPASRSRSSVSRP